MHGFESTCAFTREAIIFTGGSVVAASDPALGLEGSRPLRPFRLSVLTTERNRDDIKQETFKCLTESFGGDEIDL